MATQILVLVPGLGSDAAVWRRTIAALGEQYRCFVGDTLSDSTLQGMARRILDQIPQRFALAGVSMGGMVAMELMKIAPERVTQLALVDTNARPDTVRQKIYRRLANVAVGVTKDFERLAQRNLGSLVHPSTAQDVRAELVKMSARVGARIYIRQNRAVTARGDLRKVLPNIDSHVRDRRPRGSDDASRAVSRDSRPHTGIDVSRHSGLRPPATHREAGNHGRLAEGASRAAFRTAG
jgi:pimeloyl-ACP methyl ester carboxylesterase